MIAQALAFKPPGAASVSGLSPWAIVVLNDRPGRTPHEDAPLSIWPLSLRGQLQRVQPGADDRVDVDTSSLIQITKPARLAKLVDSQ